MRIEIEPGAQAVLAALHGAGYRAYLVGGCVRDCLAGRRPHDWDICTSARPEQTLALFGDGRCIPTGIKHGTVSVRQDGALYEVTSFRVEAGYSDGRHPDAVAFVGDVRADLARRDFTVNAMAYSAEEGLIDPFGGAEDLLARRVLRAVGEPGQRFAEDGLRVLRFYRFGAQEQLHLDEATDAAARAACGQLRHVSAERIWQELRRLLAAARPGPCLPDELLCQLLPELPPARYGGARRTVDALPPQPLVRLAALLAPAGPQAADGALARLRCSKAEAAAVSALVRESGFVPGDGSPKREAYRVLARLGPEQARQLLALRQAQSGSAAFAQLGAALDALLAEGACWSTAQLAVNGKDLLALGFAPGPAVGQALDGALAQVVAGALPNQRQALLRWLARMKEQEEQTL